MASGIVSAATRRMLEAWADPDASFTREQVAYFMSLALGSDDLDAQYKAGYEAGYWARVAEENGSYPPPPHGVAGPISHAAEVAAYRERVGVDRCEPRPGDFQGLGDEAVAALRTGDTAPYASEVDRDDL
jgi:hypothetical protein